VPATLSLTLGTPTTFGAFTPGVTRTDTPVSNDQASIEFTQLVNSTDALRTGTYSKTLTFTLSTTAP
jgi:hypothetical protein